MVRIESIQPRKQRKARYNAPAHLRGKFLSAPLSPDLRKEYRIRSVRVVKGDSVRVLRGNAAGTEGVVDAVDTDRSLIVVQGVRFRRQMGLRFPAR